LPSCSLATIVGFLPSRCLASIRDFLPSRFIATIGGIHTHTHTATWSHKPTLFFQNKGTRLNKYRGVEFHDTRIKCHQNKQKLLEGAHMGIMIYNLIFPY
jgi:hypothetical protein